MWPQPPEEARASATQPRRPKFLSHRKQEIMSGYRYLKLLSLGDTSCNIGELRQPLSMYFWAATVISVMTRTLRVVTTVPGFCYLSFQFGLGSFFAPQLQFYPLTCFHGASNTFLQRTRCRGCWGTLRGDAGLPSCCLTLRSARSRSSCPACQPHACGDVQRCSALPWHSEHGHPQHAYGPGSAPVMPTWLRTSQCGHPQALPESRPPRLVSLCHPLTSRDLCPGE